ncbi:hypothetical protein [Peribacillus glennii]|uniref:hypothetical protein n=1 Tax=Peribacillus glennii TaxID=2303991 RepID=UPI00131429D2|nr:hypothetical protein [Peribacillus glennii]
MRNLKLKLLALRKRKLMQRNKYSHRYWDNIGDDLFYDDRLKYKNGAKYQSYKWK